MAETGQDAAAILDELAEQLEADYYTSAPVLLRAAARELRELQSALTRADKDRTIWRDRCAKLEEYQGMTEPEPDYTRRLTAQAIAISVMLSDAGIGPCTLEQGVREVIAERDSMFDAHEHLHGNTYQYENGECVICRERKRGRASGAAGEGK